MITFHERPIDQYTAPEDVFAPYICIPFAERASETLNVGFHPPDIWSLSTYRPIIALMYYWQQLDRLLTHILVESAKPTAAELDTWICRPWAEKAGSLTAGTGFRIGAFSEKAVGVFFPVLFRICERQVLN